jgi:hypothetical protein
MILRGRIETPDPDYYFDINVVEMVEDQVDGTSHPLTLAMVSPTHRINLDDNSIVKGSIGLIQFRDDDNFRAGIIGHEAVHCALDYIRNFEEEYFELDIEGCDDNEERLAWLVGWFTKEITNFYYDIVRPLEDRSTENKPYPESELQKGGD